jgi:propanol-preferring alcohol dehydrogenase
MAKYRAVQITAPQKLTPTELELREPGPGEVRIKVEACGICHSDAFMIYAGLPGLKLPRVPGHELAGRIDAVGTGVNRLKAGDRVGVGWYGGHCNECDSCRRGLFLNCARGLVTGGHFDGGYAEYAIVPAMAAARIPDGLEAKHAGPLMCAGITTFNAIRNSGVRPGDTVAVQGIGGLGHLGIQFAARLGFRVVALSSGADKEPLARELGAHEYIDTGKVNAGEGLAKLGGADLVLATAPHAEAISSTVGGLTARGKVLMVAAPQEPLQVPAMALLSGRSVAGWPSGSSIDSEDTMRFAARTGVRPVIEMFPLEKAEEAFGKMMGNKVRFRAVLAMG